MFGMVFQSSEYPFKDMAHNGEVGFAGSPVKLTPNVAVVGGRADGKVLKPKELWKRSGFRGSGVGNGEEFSIGAGATSWMTAGHMGFQVSRFGEEGFGSITEATGVKSNGVQLVVGD
jgi:hypothetical protein